jgi:SpoVK/Ycf46/Vps4 family AAA+-type ATPase
MTINNLFASFNLDTVEGDLAPYLFLSAHAATSHAQLRRQYVRRGGTEAALPERSRVLQRFVDGTSIDVIVEIDGSIVWFSGRKAWTEVWVSNDDAPAAQVLVEEIKQRMPKEKRSDRVRVTFTDANARQRSLKIDARPWAEVRELYGAAVKDAMDALVEHRPKVGEARRLILWHGPAGTGKTSAIRALLRAWTWADPVVVTDPESLLSNGKYLQRTLLEEQDDNRWQLVILEDAESLLRQRTGSDAISRLLNLCDGLLGQGLRCMFLLTTNTSLGDINSAVVRPGRCLANVEFGPLSAAEAATILGRPVSRSMTLAEVMSTQPVEAASPGVVVGQYL